MLLDLKLLFDMYCNYCDFEVALNILCRKRGWKINNKKDKDCYKYNDEESCIKVKFHNPVSIFRAPGRCNLSMNLVNMDLQY